MLVDITPYARRRDHRLALVLLFMLALLVALVSLAYTPGCAVAPGSDPVLVHAEQGAQASFTAVDTFLQVEQDNRDLINAKYPELSDLATTLRREFPPAYNEFLNLITLYRKTKDADTAAAIEAQRTLIARFAADAATAVLRIQQRK
jgi:hypothetical protein